MNGYKGWRAAAGELAQIVRSAGPRVALGGAVMVVMVAGAILLRFCIFFPGVGL